MCRVFNRILLAVDGPEHALRAATVAGVPASKYDAGVVVLYAIDPSRLNGAQERMAEVEPVAERGHGPYPWVASVPAELAATLQPNGSGSRCQRMLEYLADKIVRRATERLHEYGAGDDRVRVMFRNGHPAKRIVETAK